MEQRNETTERKRLFRSKIDRIIAGVCGGFAEYFNADPTIIRILWLVLLFLTGIGGGLLIYLLCLIVMKDNPGQSYADKKSQGTSIYWGIGLVLLGLFLLSDNWGWNLFHFRPFHFFRFPLFDWWWFDWDRIWSFYPVIIILFGIFYLIYVLRKKNEPGGDEKAATEEDSTETRGHTGKLFRTRKDKIIGGVCGGIANKLDVDPVIVRIGWVILTLITHLLGVIVYIVWMVVVPEESIEQQHSPGSTQPDKKPVRKSPRRVKKLPDKKDEEQE